MASLHNGKRENLEISPNLWAGVGLVRGGAGTALVGDGPTVAARINEYAALGIDSFILSGYPHLEEAYKVGELLFPHRMSLSRKFRSHASFSYRAKPWRTRLSREKSRKAKEPPCLQPHKNGYCAPRRGFCPSALSSSGNWRLQLAGCRAAFCPLRRALWKRSGRSAPAVSCGNILPSAPRRAVIGFSIGGSIGLTLGLISGLSRWGERLLDTSVQMLRNVPHLALIPLVILWFGIDESTKIFLVALGTLFPIYINTPAWDPQYRSRSG